MSSASSISSAALSALDNELDDDFHSSMNSSINVHNERAITFPSPAEAVKCYGPADRKYSQIQTALGKIYQLKQHASRLHIAAKRELQEWVNGLAGMTNSEMEEVAEQLGHSKRVMAAIKSAKTIRAELRSGGERESFLHRQQRIAAEQAAREAAAEAADLRRQLAAIKGAKRDAVAAGSAAAAAAAAAADAMEGTDEDIAALVDFDDDEPANKRHSPNGSRAGSPRYDSTDERLLDQVEHVRIAN